MAVAFNLADVVVAALPLSFHFWRLLLLLRAAASATSKRSSAACSKWPRRLRFFHDSAAGVAVVFSCCTLTPRSGNIKVKLALRTVIAQKVLKIVQRAVEAQYFASLALCMPPTPEFAKIEAGVG